MRIGQTRGKKKLCTVLRVGTRRWERVCDQQRRLFFPPVWPIRTRHGPYNSVSGEKHLEKGLVWSKKRGQIITSTQTNNQKNATKNDPQIPQPDLRFAIKQTAKQQRTGPGPNKNQTKQLEICLEYSDLSHCIVIKNMQTN